MRPRHATVVDVHLILRRNGTLLLSRRVNTGYADGQYCLPSGHLEDGESVVEAVVREAAEEVGVTVAPQALRCVHVMHHRNPQGHARIGFFFEATHWHGEPRNREPHKCSELLWATPQNLPADTVPYPAAALAAVETGQPFAVHGWS